MIFKSLEIYFLSASEKVRWSTTFLMLLLIVCGWWHYAFQPVRTKLAALEHKFSCIHTDFQDASYQELLDDIDATSLEQRITRVGNGSHFLKDLLKYELKIRQLESQITPSLDTTSLTRLKISFAGTFEKFYEFLAYQQKNYMCSWDSCVCARSPEGTLLCDADIVLYFK